MTTRRPVFLVVGAICTLVFAGCGGGGQDPAPSPPSAAAAGAAGPAALAPGGTQSAVAGDLVCQTYCSSVEPGTPVAEVRWVVSTQPASGANLRVLAGQQNVEAAVNEDGFERGRFVRLASASPQARFAPTGQPNAPPLPGLGNLNVLAVASSQDSPGALRLATPSEGGRENVVVQVQGLQPGMNYYWRVRPPTQGEAQVVMCRAPICPADRPK